MAVLRFTAELTGYATWIGIAAVAIVLTLSFRINRRGT